MSGYAGSGYAESLDNETCAYPTSDEEAGIDDEDDGLDGDESGILNDCSVCQVRDLYRLFNCL